MEEYRDGNSILTSEINEIRRLVVNRNIKNLLEIGTYRGNLIFSLYDLIVEEHDGTITSVDIKQPNDYNNLNKMHIEEHDLKHIHLSVVGSNRFFAKTNKKFDMIILDGEQSYDQVKKDFENSLDVMTENGIILICRYRNSIPVQRVINEIDGGAYNKELIHTVHHLMAISKKERVRELHNVTVSDPRDGDNISANKIEKDKMIPEEGTRNDRLVRTSHNRIK